MIGAEDVGQIYKAGSERTKGLDREAWNYGAEAKAQRSKASGAIVSGFISAASTALAGASQASMLKASLNPYAKVDRVVGKAANWMSSALSR